VQMPDQNASEHLHEDELHGTVPQCMMKPAQSTHHRSNAGQAISLKDPRSLASVSVILGVSGLVVRIFQALLELLQRETVEESSLWRLTWVALLSMTCCLQGVVTPDLLAHEVACSVLEI